MNTGRAIRAAAFGALALCAVSCTGGANPDPAPAAPPKKVPLSKEEWVTEDKYKKVNVGMTHAQVVAVIGFDGEETMRIQYGDESTTTHVWMNPDGRYMEAIFRNGKLKNKCLVGLH